LFLAYFQDVFYQAAKFLSLGACLRIKQDEEDFFKGEFEK